MPVRRQDDHIRLAIRLTPKGGRDTVDGLADTPTGGAVKARVAAPPEDGKANAALQRLIAKWIGVPPSAVTLASGGKSRDKILRIAGDPAALERIIRAKLQQAN